MLRFDFEFYSKFFKNKFENLSVPIPGVQVLTGMNATCILHRPRIFNDFL